MKTILFVLLGGIFVLPAAAASASFTLEGQVMRIDPRVRYGTPQYERECWTEDVPVRSSSNRSLGGAIVGGIAGGVIGHQVGGGRGKDAATFAGAALGALVGDKVDNSDRREPSIEYQTRQRCRSPQPREIPDGYNVTVRVLEQDMLFQMRDNPGYGTIRLNFNGTITPARW